MNCKECGGKGKISINLKDGTVYENMCGAKNCIKGQVNKYVVVQPEYLSDFWQSCYPNGMTQEDVANELADFHIMLDNVPTVYCEVTGNKLSKPLYDADTVLSVYRDDVQKQIDEALEENLEILAASLDMPLKELKNHL